MAASVKKLAAADIGIGITGIAGPAGATLYKPVGTVFIAINASGRKTCRKFFFRGNRQTVRKNAVRKALKLLCAALR